MKRETTLVVYAKREKKKGREGELDLVLKMRGFDITGEKRIGDLNWFDYRRNVILDELTKYDIDPEQREADNEGKTREQIDLEEKVELKIRFT
jgi:hypothetical protein